MEDEFTSYQTITRANTLNKEKTDYYLTGFADEAAKSLDGQIKATLELGWENIESRNIDGTNIHDLSDAEFDVVYGKLQDSGVKINCFGSAVANWAKLITEPLDTSIAEARRAVPRMQKLGTKLIRIMSFAVCEDRDPEDQMEEERYRRLRELQKVFNDGGITPVHENCMNFGGMGWKYSERMLENVPGLKLVFDTGNPVFNPDRSKPKPWPRQSAWEFYDRMKEHIAYIHIKDAKWDKVKQEAIYTLPGQGDADVKKILQDLLANDYKGGISIEPHLAVVFHDEGVESSEEKMYNSYVEYGQTLMSLLNDISVNVCRAA